MNLFARLKKLFSRRRVHVPVVPAPRRRRVVQVKCRIFSPEAPEAPRERILTEAELANYLAELRSDYAPPRKTLGKD